MYFYTQGIGRTNMVFVYMVPTLKFGKHWIEWWLPRYTGSHMQQALESYTNRRRRCLRST